MKNFFGVLLLGVVIILAYRCGRYNRKQDSTFYAEPSYNQSGHPQAWWDGFDEGIHAQQAGIVPVTSGTQVQFAGPPTCQKSTLYYGTWTCLFERPELSK